MQSFFLATHATIARSVGANALCGSLSRPGLSWADFRRWLCDNVASTCGRSRAM